jgi:phosphatidylglycerol---prolipoprotein diacylglyceryl transferase
VLPYFEQPTLHLGPITIHAFGVIVAVGVWLGLALGSRRMRFLGLDQRLGDSLAAYALICGFLGAHLFSLFFYFPSRVVSDPWVLLRVWDPLSSFGGVLGGLIGVLLFLRLKGRELDATTRWAYLDVLAFVFPISLAIGRLGCTVAHDHPGVITRFPLAVSLQTTEAQAYITGYYAIAGRIAELPPGPELARFGFHDLGWYEFLYLAILVVPVTLALGRRQRTPGTFLVSFIALYMPARFALDFLRVGDARYLGLTPAQWTAIAIAAALPVLWRGLRARQTLLRSVAVIAVPMGLAAACTLR